jgi:putative membrane protein
MKGLLRQLLSYGVAIYLAEISIPGVVMGGEWLRTIALVSGALFGFNLILKPVLNIFLLPFNILTLGILSWFVNVITLFAVTKIIPEFRVTSFFFPGAKLAGIILPAMEVGEFLALVITAVAIGLVTRILHWLSE